jgi:hypothetical protein
MRPAGVVAPLVILCASVAPTTAAQSALAAVPSVDVWISNPPVALAHTAPVSARAVADPQAYIVVFRVTPDNRIIVVAPRTPYGAYRVPNGGLRSGGLDVSFRAEQTNGVGHIFAVASYTPFDFSQVRSGGAWNREGLQAPAHKDAIDVADWFVQQIIPSRTTPYGVNNVAYYVGVTPPTDAQMNAQQNTLDNAAQYAPQNAVVYVDDPSYYDQYGYSAYVPWYNNNFYWYDTYANSLGSGYVKRCSDGSVVSIHMACPVVLQGGHPHTMVPRKPTPPHVMPAWPLSRSPLPATQVQALLPPPLLTPSALNGRSTQHNAYSATPRPVTIVVYNRPIVHPTPTPAPRLTQSAPPTPPSYTESQEHSQRH